MAIKTTIAVLASLIYHECSTCNNNGKLAVAHVAINRSKDQNKSIMTIISQKHQFSWYKSKASLKIPSEVRSQYEEVAQAALNTHDITGGSLYFKKKTNTSRCFKNTKYTKSISKHIFCKPYILKKRVKNGRHK